MMVLALAPLLLWSGPARGEPGVETEALAESIAASLSHLKGDQYKTAAFSRIRQAGGPALDVNELIDYANVKIVQDRRLRVIDRSKLQLVLQEQKMLLSDVVSAKDYQELGKLLGVDLFIYGTIYADSLVLKAIDVQTSVIIWAQVFPLGKDTPRADLLKDLGRAMIRSMRDNLTRLKEEATIQSISFWSVNSPPPFQVEETVDFLTVAITRDGSFHVVDRENLRLILDEQRLNQASFIDESHAKRLGELYGVDAFIYGGITRKQQGSYIASLKLLNILSGVIEWADLIKVGANPSTSEKSSAKKSEDNMVEVSGTTFLQGTNGSPVEAQPLHQVRVTPFLIDSTEVSNGEYLNFLKAKKYRMPVGWQNDTYPDGKANLPVVGVSWEDSRNYCRYAHKRLPAESEWEMAARGSKGQTYPWTAESFTPGIAITRESGSKGPVDVNSTTMDSSPFGAVHMAGNVREWVEDLFNPYPGSRATNNKYGRERVVRGGSWATDSRAAATYFRGSSQPNLAWQDVGFRCAKSIPSISAKQAP